MQNHSQKNSRNVTYEAHYWKIAKRLNPAKMLEKCFAQRKAEPQQVLSLSHCETAARKIAETLPLEPTKKKQKDGKPASNQAKPKKKVFGERMRKSRTPAGFVPKPCKTVARKTLETSPTKRTTEKQQNVENVTDGTAKPKKKVFGERMRKSRTPAGFVPKPCKAVARKTLETSPTKRTTERKIAKRLKRKHYWKIAKRPKRHRRNGKTQEKGLWGAHAKKQNPSRFRA